MGGPSSNVLGLPGSRLFGKDEEPGREQTEKRHNKSRRERKRKIRERQRQWRLSRDQTHNT